MFEDAIITDAGIALLSRWASGGTLTIDGAEAGTGVVDTAALKAQTAISGAMQALPIVSWKAGGTGVEYNVQFTAAPSAYIARQIGIYAHLNSEARVLIALFQDRTGLQIPAAAEMPDFVFAFYATLQMSATGDIRVTVDVNALASGEEVRRMKEKLDKIEDGANRYVHPTTAGNRHIPAGGKAGQILRWAADGTAQWGAEQGVNIAIDDEVTETGVNAVSGKAVAAYIKKQLDAITNYEEVSF